MLHLLFPEIAEIRPESRIILLQDLAEKLGICLRNNVVKGISIDKRFFDTGMRVQIEVEFYLLLSCKGLHELGDMVNRGTILMMHYCYSIDGF